MKYEEWEEVQKEVDEQIDLVSNKVRGGHHFAAPKVDGGYDQVSINYKFLINRDWTKEKYISFRDELCSYLEKSYSIGGKNYVERNKDFVEQVI